MIKTREILDRKKKLEGDCEAKVAEIEKLKDSLAQAYAGNGDPVELMGKLNAVKSDLSTMVEALVKLDKIAFDIQLSEHKELSRTVEEEAKKTFTEIMGDVAKGVKPIRKVVKRAITSEAAVKRLMQQILDSVGEVVWAQMLSDFNEKYREKVPCFPGAIPGRDELGRVIK